MLKNKPACRRVFGPVPSRRLGRSLGVDLVELKTCTYDCVYCQLGRTGRKTAERRMFSPASEIIEETRSTLASGCSPDYITLSGSGEPTLHAGIGSVIAGLKKITRIPIAVLTNGSLLADGEVRGDLARADLVIPSLDAGDEAMFQAVNRPHPDIDFMDMVEGLARFCRSFRGQVWLEVFLIKNMNAVDEEVAKIARLAKRLRLSRVQLNTVARPPAEDFIHAASSARMARYCGFFMPRAAIIAGYAAAGGAPRCAIDADEVLALLRRRPCTLRDIAAGLRVNPSEAAKQAGALLERGAVRRTRRGPDCYFETR